MKTAHDLVAAAKSEIKEVELADATQAIQDLSLIHI